MFTDVSLSLNPFSINLSIEPPLVKSGWGSFWVSNSNHHNNHHENSLPKLVCCMLIKTRLLWIFWLQIMNLMTISAKTKKNQKIKTLWFQKHISITKLVTPPTTTTTAKATTPSSNTCESGWSLTTIFQSGAKGCQIWQTDKAGKQLVWMWGPMLTGNRIRVQIQVLSLQYIPKWSKSSIKY